MNVIRPSVYFVNFIVDRLLRWLFMSGGKHDFKRLSTRSPEKKLGINFPRYTCLIPYIENAVNP